MLESFQRWAENTDQGKKKTNRNKDNVLHQGPKKSAVPVQKRRHGLVDLI